MKLIIKEGQKFNNLTVIKESDKIRLPSGQVNRVFLCKCDCGFEKNIRLSHLYTGRIKSCGCKRSAGVRIKSDDERRLRKVYRQILNRCSENYFQSHLYFKKGIKVTDKWINNITEFTNWSLQNGYKEGLVIDRTDNSKGYSPENCKWVTPSINCVNKDNTIFVIYKGIKISLIKLLAEKKLLNNLAAIRARIKRGWDYNKAVDTPIRKGNYYKTKLYTNEELEQIKFKYK
jgi:hypothetical protein